MYYLKLEISSYLIIDYNMWKILYPFIQNCIKNVHERPCTAEIFIWLDLRIVFYLHGIMFRKFQCKKKKQHEQNARIVLVKGFCLSKFLYSW